jgi:hypothetical protein
MKDKIKGTVFFTIFQGRGFPYSGDALNPAQKRIVLHHARYR